VKKILFAVPAVLLLFTGFLTDESLARGSFYNMAKRQSSTIVRSSWRSLGGDCHKADQLMQIIGDAVDRVTRDIRNRKFRGRMAVDFGNGYIDGLVGALDDIVNKCSDECSMIGQASGEWSSEIFCAVSEVIGSTAEFDGLTDIPNLICGEAYRISCESTFVGKAKGMCGQFAQNQRFHNYYRASSNGCCAYNRQD
jgi:hypothetical protein